MIEMTQINAKHQADFTAFSSIYHYAFIHLSWSVSQLIWGEIWTGDLTIYKNIQLNLVMQSLRQVCFSS